MYYASYKFDICLSREIGWRSKSSQAKIQPRPADRPPANPFLMILDDIGLGPIACSLVTI